MHWEGTAPWAPPYVWPPFGGTGEFYAFRDTLHASGDLLGVYCSGFGCTAQSNLIDSYNCKSSIEREHLLDAMCAAPGVKVLRSRICTGQRSGYDICPACARGRDLLQNAYSPLFGTVDYPILPRSYTGSELSYTVTVPKILSTAWESGDERVQILVNYTDSQVDYTMDGTTESIMPFNAKMVRL